MGILLSLLGINRATRPRATGRRKDTVAILSKGMVTDLHKATEGGMRNNHSDAPAVAWASVALPLWVSAVVYSVVCCSVRPWTEETEAATMVVMEEAMGATEVATAVATVEQATA